ncbi:hypothetical protein D3C71_2167890 [compost metagenome]
MKECELYLLNLSNTDPDTFWVTEVWSHEEAHAASLTGDAVKASIQRARPLIASIESMQTTPAGGKGLLL